MDFTYQQNHLLCKNILEVLQLRLDTVLATKPRFKHVILRRKKLILIFNVNMQHIYDIQMLPAIPFIAIKKNFEYMFYVLVNSFSKEMRRKKS